MTTPRPGPDLAPATPAARHPHPHESAHLHVSGEAMYVDDLPELARTAHAALGLSTQVMNTRSARMEFMRPNRLAVVVWPPESKMA